MTMPIAPMAFGTACLLAVLAASGVPAGAWWMAHLALALALGCVWPRRRDDAWRAVAVALAFPGLGAIGAWWLSRCGLAQPLGPCELPPPVVPPCDAEEWPDAPMADIWQLGLQLAEGPLDMKLGAAAAMAALEGPTVVRVLRGLLTHANPHTRLVASLELQKREETICRALQAARQAHGKVGQADSAIALAREARRYASSGLPTGAAVEALWRDAVRAAEEALAIGSSGMRAQALSELACARLALGDQAEALSAAEAALSLNPRCSVAAYARCQSLLALGAHDRLASAAADWARLFPEHPAARHWAFNPGT